MIRRYTNVRSFVFASAFFIRHSLKPTNQKFLVHYTKEQVWDERTVTNTHRVIMINVRSKKQKRFEKREYHSPVLHYSLLQYSAI